MSASSSVGGFPDLFGGSTTVLSAALNGLSKRHDAITGNIANASTPGYQKRVVQFEDQLSKALAASDKKKQETAEAASSNMFTMTEAGHINVDFEHEAEGSVSMERLAFENKPEQSGVDVETEMVDLARNTQKYLAVSHLAFQDFEGLRNIIKNTSG